MVTSVTKNKPDAPAAPEVESNKVESLESIAALGTSLDKPAATPGQSAAVQAEEKAAVAEIATALALLRVAAIPFAPEHVHDPLNAVWSDDQLEKIGEAIVDICKLQGITVSEFFTKYGPYIRLCMVLGVPALATIKILKIPKPKAADGQQQ